MAVQPQPYRFTVDEYHRMAVVGILGEDDRVELIEGAIVEMAPIGSRHAAAVDRLAHAFSSVAGGSVIVRVQSPIRLGERTEPQPDLAILRPRGDFYRADHPGPGDVLLVVEVAEASGSYDRLVKLPLYARAGIPEMWIVDLSGGRVEVHRSPSDEGYRTVWDLAGLGRARRRWPCLRRSWA